MTQKNFSVAVCFFISCTIISAAEPIRHRLLLLDESRSQLLYVDQIEPEKSWNVKIDDGPAWGIQLVGNNRVLVAMPKKGGFREYDLTTHQAVREYFDPNRYAGTMAAARFPDGRTVLGCDRNGVRLFLLDAENHEIAAWEFPELKIIRQIRRTVRNTLLFGSNTDRIYEVALDGKIVREFQLPDAKHHYQVSELPNGNWLTAAGYGGFLAEIDRENKEVRRWGGNPAPEGLLYFFMSQFQTLKNGHLVVATWTGHGANDSEKGQQAVEFDADGKVVWTWHDPKLAGSIHGIIVLDDLDTKQFYDDTIFTKNFSNEIVKDWITQDEKFRIAQKIDVPFSPVHTQQVIDSAFALSKRIRTIPGADQMAIEMALVSLKKLKSTLVAATPEQYESLYLEARQCKRAVIRCNPHLAGLQKLLFITKHDADDPSFHMCDQFYGFTARPGGGLYVLENPLSDSPKLVDLLENSVVEQGRMKGRKLQGGAFLSPEVSFDGKTIYFAYCEAKASDVSWKQEKSVPYYHEWSESRCYHLFRCNADGTGLVQLTDGSVNDFDPCELPDGRIAFISERRGGFLRCGRYCPVYTLFSMEPDGSDIVCLSYHETHEWQPSVDNNGMLVYTRWDYVDRDTNVAHHLWTCFPDGRDPRSYHGNYPVKREARPWMEMDVRAIPNSHRYVAVTGAHHGHAFGSLVLIDQRLEDDGAMSQITRLTPEVPFPEAERKPTNLFMVYGTPYPFSEDDFLCVYDSEAKNRGVYWIDAAGNRELIYRDPAISSHSPLPLAARQRPPIIPTQTTQMVRSRSEKQTGDEKAFVGIINVYQSDSDFPTVDGQPVKIKAIRIIQLFAKSTPVPDDPKIGIARQTNARGVLGTVPVEEDGSAFFEAPVGKPIYFQALDEHGRALQSMRSATYLHPGEQLTCIGCHENKRSGQPSRNMATSLAFNRPPSVIRKDVSGSYPLNFVQLVQPVLDNHCVQCHGDKEHPAGADSKTKHSFDLTGITDAPNGWTRSYQCLAKNYGFYFDSENGSIKDPIHGGSRTTAGKFGASASGLRDFLNENHYSVKLSPEERHRIDLWLDANSVFYGTYENTRIQSLGKDVRPALE